MCVCSLPRVPWTVWQWRWGVWGPSYKRDRTRKGFVCCWRIWTLPVVTYDSSARRFAVVCQAQMHRASQLPSASGHRWSYSCTRYVQFYTCLRYLSLPLMGFMCVCRCVRPWQRAEGSWPGWMLCSRKWQQQPLSSSPLSANTRDFQPSNWKTWPLKQLNRYVWVNPAKTCLGHHKIEIKIIITYTTGVSKIF